jgi:hypothetical protein
MAIKAQLIVIDSEVYGKTLSQGYYLGTVKPLGKGWVDSRENKVYNTREAAVLALARGQNRRFAPRATFHKSRINWEDAL